MAREYTGLKKNVHTLSVLNNPDLSRRFFFSLFFLKITEKKKKEETETVVGWGVGTKTYGATTRKT